MKEHHSARADAFKRSIIHGSGSKFSSYLKKFTIKMPKVLTSRTRKFTKAAVNALLPYNEEYCCL